MAALAGSLVMPANFPRLSCAPSSSISSTLNSPHPPLIFVGAPSTGNRFSAIAWRVRLGVAARKNPRLLCRASFGPSQGELKESLNRFLAEHKVVLFMKGNRTFPQCGFSNTVVQILNSMNVPYETVNILEDDGLRQGLKEYSSWPTFPQLYIDGEFFGGCDITLEAYQNGQLKEVVEKAMCS